MRVIRDSRLMLAALAAILLLDRPLWAAEAKDPSAIIAANAADDAPEQETPARKGRPAGTKDPVTAAFALPKGVVLNSQQRAAYDSLKQAKEGELRQAIDAMHDAEDGNAKIKATKEVKECRAKIRADIQEIISTPYGDAGKSASESKGGSSEASGSSGSGPAYGGSGGPYPYQSNYYPAASYNPYYRRSYGYPYPYPYTPSQGERGGSTGTGGTHTSTGSSKGTSQGTPTTSTSARKYPYPSSKPTTTSKPNTSRPSTSKPSTSRPK